MPSQKANIQVDATKKGVLIIDGRKYRGHIYLVSGREVEVYALNVLGAAIGKSSNTIRRWEKNGELPPPLFVVVGQGVENQRWYSRQQIVNLYQVHNRFPFSQGKPHFREAFFSAIAHVFYEENIIDVANTSFRTARTATATRAADGGTVTTGRTATTHTGAGERKNLGYFGIPNRFAKKVPAPSRPTAPEASQPGPSGGMAGADLAGYQSPENAPDRRYSQPQSIADAPERHRGHIASPHPRPVQHGTDYRRRPKSSAG